MNSEKGDFKDTQSHANFFSPKKIVIHTKKNLNIIKKASEPSVHHIEQPFEMIEPSHHTPIKEREPYQQYMLTQPSEILPIERPVPQVNEKLPTEAAAPEMGSPRK